ncbi:MAG: hypothetical protein V5A23_05075 [Halobacteriales archaeon]
MSVPGVVEAALGDEEVAAEVSLGGEDRLFVTPTRTILYRGEGILSDEAIEEYSHEADRVEVSVGRRKARITLVDDLAGDRSFTVPPNLLEDALHPVLAGVLNDAGVTEPGETVKRTFRFSELTVIVTSRRLVKHIGEAVWDQDYEEHRYEDVSDLDFEEGSVATQVVLEIGGRRERIKAPNQDAPELRAELEEALFDFFDVGSIEELRRAAASDDGQDDPEAAASAEDGDISFEGGLSPLNAGGQGDGEDAAGADSATAASAESMGGRDAGGRAEAAASSQGGPSQPATGDTGRGGAESSGAEQATDPGGGSMERAGDTESVEGDLVDGDAVSNEKLAERLDELTTAVKRQNELLETQARTVEQLIEELKQMH